MYKVEVLVGGCIDVLVIQDRETSSKRDVAFLGAFKYIDAYSTRN